MKLGSKQYNKSFSIFVLVLLLVLILSLVSSAHAQNTNGTEPGAPDASLSKLSGKDYIESTPGETEFYILTLTNQGKQPESFLISVESNYSWNPEIDPQTSRFLIPDESEDITFEFQIPDNLDDGDYEFQVLVKSGSSPLDSKIIHVIAHDKEVIITTKIEPVLFIKPSKDNLGQISPGEQVELEVEVSCYVISAEVYLDHKVFKILDNGDVEEKNINVVIDDNNKKIKKGSYEVFIVTVKFPKNFDRKVDYSCNLWLKPEANGFNAYSKNTIIRFAMFNEPEEDSFIAIISTPTAIAGITSLLAIGIIGTALGSTEVGKFRILSLLFIPLYTKLHKNKILDHFTRGRVYEYIRNNPGVHYSEIKRELDLNNGNLTYHLHTLEREELIKSRTSGRFKLFYPTGVKIPSDMEPQVSSIRRQILDIIREHPGISQKELGLMLPTKKQRTISYHIKNMSREGVVELRKDGRETKCYLADKVIEIKNDGVIFQEVERNAVEGESQPDSFFRQI
jgi:DNA-binding MarR family transcriptional regulator